MKKLLTFLLLTTLLSCRKEGVCWDCTLTNPNTGASISKQVCGSEVSPSPIYTADGVEYAIFCKRQ